MDKTLVFVDDGFLSKLSKYFGDGNARFSTSNELIQSVHKYVLLQKKGFEVAKLK